MSDSEDDFVEVGGYQSSDSDWEKISGYSSSEEVPRASSNGGGQWSPELVTSYYRMPEGSQKQHLQEQQVPALQLTENLQVDYTRCTSPSSDGDSAKSRPNSRSDSSKVNSQGSKKKYRWSKVSMKQGSGAPYDPVEFLGISGGEKSLLGHFGITTIGQLAYFNAVDFVSNTAPEKYSVILDLQERAYRAVTEYVTNPSQTDIVWGYLYLGDKHLEQILKKGYLDSDSLYYLWTPMPLVLYQNQLAIDELVGNETHNRELKARYTRFVKINLTRLCNKHRGRLYQRDPESLAAPDKWFPVTLHEAATFSQREDFWFSFEPGNEIFSCVAHGSIVIPTGRIPKDCVELDKETCMFSANSEDSESSDDEREEPNLTVAAKFDYLL